MPRTCIKVELTDRFATGRESSFANRERVYITCCLTDGDREIGDMLLSKREARDLRDRLGALGLG